MPHLNDTDAPVTVAIENALMTITLNRPKAINSLNLEMIRRIQDAMNQAAKDDTIKLVLLAGAGDRGFCAGADVKAAVNAIQEGRKADAMQFFIEEYALDLCIHRFAKPVVAMANGVTMGGGLGLTAGSDVVIATETTRMAMPETRIGFIPDVGATGWLFDKCPKGYAEYLGLTGQEIEGAETVRLGLADVCIPNKNIAEAIQALKTMANMLEPEKEKAVFQIKQGLSVFCQEVPAEKTALFDQWVADTFSGRTTIMDVIAALTQSPDHREKCQSILEQLAERSPTATVLTLNLMRQNEGTLLDDVFSAETKACEYIISHPDYSEGVRARLIDKDNQPKWQPDTFDKVGEMKVDISV